MLLRVNEDSRNRLQDTVLDYYEHQGRPVSRQGDGVRDDGWMEMVFLIDRRHVIRIEVGNDPSPGGDRWVMGLALAIGPYFFGPADFWSYEQSGRFRHSSDTDDVLTNLKLVDEFLSGPEI